MKESIFNIYTETEGHKLLFNSLYCGLCEIDDSFHSALMKTNAGEQLIEEEQALVDSALKAGFFVEDGVDELDYLKINKYKSKFDESAITITIAPTLSCNFNCIYCYEDNKTGIMTKSIEEKICSYIENKSEIIKHLSVTWYGGEPMLAKQTIYRMSEQICKICSEHSIEYRAAMVTNGSLISEEDIGLFKRFHINTIQITLDGPANIHNKRRICDSIPNNFEQIVDNINLLLKEKLNIYIRVNVDKNNISSMEELVHYLDMHLINKNVNIGFSKVSACTDVCSNVVHDCFNTEEFSKEYFKLYSLIEKYGFDVGTPLKYARPKVNYCGADVYGSFVIDAFGYIYKCWHDVGDIERSIGSVDDIELALSSSKAAKWVFVDALENNDCKKCKVLPLCMGGCPSQCFFEATNKICDEVKYNISQILIRNYYKKITKGDSRNEIHY